MSLWDNNTAAQATGGVALGSWQASRVVIDSRAVMPGDLFVAIKGERFDGHAFVQDALAKGAVAAVVSDSSPIRGEVRGGVQHGMPEQVSPLPNPPPTGEGTLLIVPDTLKALEDLGIINRNRSKAKVVGVTGSVGKTSTKEMLKLALDAQGKTYATSGNYNNHIGTPLNLANMPMDTEYAVFEMGMNHAGEIAHLTRMVRPDVAVITNIEAVHLEFFASLEKIAEAKAEIFEGVKQNGTAILNADSHCIATLRQRANALHILQCGNGEGNDSQLIDYKPVPSGCEVRANIAGQEYEYVLSATGRHFAELSVLVLSAVHALGLDVTKSARELSISGFHEPEGRGKQVPLVVAQGKRKFEVILVDDSYNASPVSMRAAIAKIDGIWETRGGRERKLAVLGDMLELGKSAAEEHKKLSDVLQKHRIDTIFTAGTLMQHLHDALPVHMRGEHAATSLALLPVLQQALQPGDILLIKGSHGSKMYELAAALQEMGAEKNMLYNLLFPLADKFELFNLFRYLTFRSGAAVFTALLMTFFFGPKIIRWLKSKQAEGQPIRLDGPESHLVTKKGTPTMGGVMILLSVGVSTLLWADLTNPYIWIVLLVTLGFGFLGFIDDYLKLTRRNSKGLSSRKKLLGQALVSILAALAIQAVAPEGMKSMIAVPFFKNVLIDAGILYAPFVLLVLVGASNAVNLTDGLDGLAIVPIMIVAGCFALIAYLVGNAVFAKYLELHYISGSGELAVFCASLVGASLGFLWFNAPPAQVFMGDTGSLAFGGSLGAISVITRHELVLAILGGLFVVEAVSVIIQVASFKMTGKRVFKMAPIHHHFEKLGWKEPTIVIRFWIIACIFALLGLSTLKLR